MVYSRSKQNIIVGTKIANDCTWLTHGSIPVVVIRVARLFVKYLAVYNNENLSNIMKNSVKCLI